MSEIEYNPDAPHRMVWLYCFPEYGDDFVIHVRLYDNGAIRKDDWPKDVWAPIEDYAPYIYFDAEQPSIAGAREQFYALLEVRDDD